MPSRDGARQKALDELRREPRTMVFYEASRRLADSLGAMALAFGESRDAAVVSEITKTYDRTARGTLGELERRFRTTPAPGEHVIVVAGASEDSNAEGVALDLHEALEVLREAGLGLKQASAVIARLTGKGRREVYQQALKSSGGNEPED